MAGEIKEKVQVGEKSLMATKPQTSIKSGVWEEALLEELLYLIAHIAHSEQHLLEIEAEIGEPTLAALIDGLRILRKNIGQILLDYAGLRSEGGGGEFRGGAENLWCTIKHLSMALVHCDENIEKIIRRIDDQKAINSLKVLYDARRILRETLMNLVLYIPKTVDLTQVNEVRCREDLCIEDENLVEQPSKESKEKD
ncbi:hypothetical protein JCM10135_04270 [Stetteria hydrogenophila]